MEDIPILHSRYIEAHLREHAKHEALCPFIALLPCLLPVRYGKTLRDAAVCLLYHLISWVLRSKERKERDILRNIGNAYALEKPMVSYLIPGT